VPSRLERLGAPTAEALAFVRAHCELLATEATTATEAILELATSASSSSEPKSRAYVVATQDAELRKLVRRLPGVPTAHFSNTVLSLDAPSPASLNAAARAERGRTRADDDERELARTLAAASKKQQHKEPEQRSAAAEASTFRPKKRPAAPNPLSCLKSKKARGGGPAATPPEVETTKRRARKKRKQETTVSETDS